MPPLLAGLATISYNGYAFDGTAEVKVSVRSVEDEARRTVIYREHTITVAAIIAGGTAQTDLEMMLIRQRLGQHGKALIFTNTGFGYDLIVNNGGAVNDINWGPKSTVLSFEPIGANKACSIVWQCVVCLPLCPLNDQLPIIAWNYSATFRIDKHGDVTRNISGTLQIAQVRRGDIVSDSADIYRRIFQFRVPAGFERTQTWGVSSDKAKLSFQIEDRQIPSPNPYPAYVTEIRGSHSVSWRRQGGAGFRKWFNSIEMSISPHSGISGAYAWNVFLQILLQRLAISKSNDAWPIILSMDVREDLFGRACGFSARYSIMTCLSRLIEHSALWTHIGTSWTQWRASMEDGLVVDPYGKMQMSVKPTDDLIVDPCATTIGEHGDYVQGQQQAVPPIWQAANEKPPPQYSYLLFENRVIAGRKQPVSRQSRIQGPEVRAPENPDMRRDEPFNWGIEQRPALPDKLQVGGKGRYTLTMFGRAIRAGYPIPRPALEPVNLGDPNDRPVETGGAFEMTQTDNGIGIPIFKAAWWLEFAVSGPPLEIKPHGSPTECTDTHGHDDLEPHSDEPGGDPPAPDDGGGHH